MLERLLRWLGSRFELRRHGQDQNLASMEGLRGLAVFLVFLVHFGSAVSTLLPAHSLGMRAAEAFGMFGHVGVDLFFVISGYLIYGALIGRHRRFWPYMRRRLQRIYPAFLVVFAIYLVLSWVMPSQSKLPQGTAEALRYILWNVLLLPGIFTIEPLITVAWSLSYELFYYLIIPLVISVFRLRAWSRSARVTFFLLIAFGIAAFCAVHGGPVQLIMFVSGILLAEAIRSNHHFSIQPLAVWCVVGMAVAITMLRSGGHAGFALRTAALFIAFFLLCHTCFSQSRGVTTRAFSWTPMRWLGNMSYSYYLIHGLALKFVFWAMYLLWPKMEVGTGAAAGLLAVCFFLTLLPSAALFLLVERPLSLDVRAADYRVGGATALHQTGKP